LLLELQLRQFQLGVIRNFVFINIDLGLPLVHGLDVFLGNAMTDAEGVMPAPFLWDVQEEKLACRP
jgi:hypothetical protein